MFRGRTIGLVVTHKGYELVSVLNAGERFGSQLPRFSWLPVIRIFSPYTVLLVNWNTTLEVLIAIYKT